MFNSFRYTHLTLARNLIKDFYHCFSIKLIIFRKPFLHLRFNLLTITLLSILEVLVRVSVFVISELSEVISQNKMQTDDLTIYPNTPQLQTIYNPALIHPLSAFVARSNQKYNQVLRTKQQRIVIQQLKGSNQKQHQGRTSSLPRAIDQPRSNLLVESLLLQPKQRQSFVEKKRQKSVKEEEEEAKIEKLQPLQRKLQTSNDELIDESVRAAAIRLSFHESKKLVQQLKGRSNQDIEKTKIILQNILTGMQHKLEEVTTEKHMRIMGMQIKTFTKLQEQATVRSKAASQEKERDSSKSFVEESKRKEICTPHQGKRKNISPSKNQQQMMKTNPNFRFSMTDYSQLSREQLFQMKLISYHNFLFLISSQSNFYSIPQSHLTELKFKVGRGNNSLLLKECMKTRWWWNLMTSEVEDSEINFIWTQIKVPSYMGGQPFSVGAIPSRFLSQSSSDIRRPKETGMGKKHEKYGKYAEPMHKLLSENHSHELKGVEKSIQEYVKYAERNSLRFVNSDNIKIHNHVERNYHLGNKKAMFHNMRKYYELTKQDLFQHIPVTFHIQKGAKDKVYAQFLEFYKQLGKRNSTWIVKPGELTNRGNGITVCQSLAEIHKIISKKQTHPNGKPFTYLVQKYIEKPLLYNKRKFDIRCYFLITQFNHIMRAYWYEEGYLRTSCEEFDLRDPTNLYIHLTNDAIQKNADDYGKYEHGNKLSFAEFQRYLDMWHSHDKVDFYRDIYPLLKQIATNALKAVYLKLEPHKKDFNFEVFGLDFMIDEQYKPWLIEINTNPCLELSSPLLGRLIPAMIENALRLSIDTLVPPPDGSVWPPCKKHLIFYDNVLENNRFQLIFDDREDATELKKLYQNSQELDGVDDMDEEEEEYKSDDD